MPKRKNNQQSEDELEEEEEHRYFLHPDSVSRHLSCSVCQEVFVDPQRAPCGHSYCRRCIHAWLKQSPTCPEDRKPIRKGDLHHDFILENIIGDQMVACPFRRVGCDFVGQLQTLTSHKKSCTFNPTNMPEFLKKDVLKHCSPEKDEVFEDSDEEIPAAVKPSLKMRLFNAGGGQRNLLCQMFKDDDGTSKECTKNKRSRGPTL